MSPQSIIELVGWGRVFEPPVDALPAARRLDDRHSRSFFLARVRTMIALLSIMFAARGMAQEASLNAPSTSEQSLDPFRGADRCKSCHQKANPDHVTKGVIDFVSMNESVVWGLDVHSKAFAFIDPETSALGKQICEKLGIKNIHQSRECLSCHSDWRPEQTEKPSTYTSGVACESCHGPSRKWDGEHSEEFWRAKSVADKAKVGMIDVRNPVTRAEQCFGCHIGNAAEGKIITHEMYAAGHPPLPSIEIESFAQQMPRHWRYLDEKAAESKAVTPPFKFFDEFVRENYKYLKLESDDINKEVKAHMHRPAAVILGSAIALREYVELLRDLAIAEEKLMLELASAKQEPNQDSADAKKRVQHAWPELATLDCRACHHELEKVSLRQEQRVGSTPGRPTIPKWPTTLVQLAISHASSDDDVHDVKLAAFRNKLAAVHSELERTPFGNASQMKKACSNLLDWLEEEVIAPAVAKPFKSGAVTKSFKLLIEIGSEEQHDFDSARQIAWAMRILSCGISNQALRKEIDDSLAVLALPLRLDLLNGPPHQCGPINIKELDAERQLVPLASDLPNAFAAPVHFDAELFRQQMQKLSDLLR